MLTKELNEKLPRSGRDARAARCCAATGTRSPGASSWTSAPRSAFACSARIWSSTATAPATRAHRRGLPPPTHLPLLRHPRALRHPLPLPRLGTSTTRGNCLEQPAEPEDSTFKDRVQAVTYPVQEMGGLALGLPRSAPAPQLPHYDLFVCDDAIRQIGVTVIPCNWVQCMENSSTPPTSSGSTATTRTS